MCGHCKPLSLDMAFNLDYREIYFLTAEIEMRQQIRNKYDLTFYISFNLLFPVWGNRNVKTTFFNSKKDFSIVSEKYNETLWSITGFFYLSYQPFLRKNPNFDLKGIFDKISSYFGFWHFGDFIDDEK